MTRFSFRIAALLCATVAVPHVADAQTVDYAALQETMGEPVTTSVTGKPQRASDAPASVTVITRDEIIRSPARDVPGLLHSYAGVDVNRWTAGQSDVAVRGGVQSYNARLLVLVNGRQVYLDHYGMTDWNLLGVQLAEIQQIELVRGPASALFGFNAASAVVNIITVDPMAGQTASVGAELGTHGYDRLSASAAMPLGSNVGIRLSAGQQREDERAIPATLYQPPRSVDPRHRELSGTLTAAVDAHTRIEIEGGHDDNRQLEFLPSQLITEQHFRTSTAGARVDHDTGWGSLTAHGYANWLDVGYGIGLSSTGEQSVGGLFYSRLHNRTIVGEGSALVRLGLANTARIGVEYRNNRLQDETQFSSVVRYDVVAGSAMVDLHPSDRMAVTLAARLDHLMLGQSGTPLQPAANDVADYDRAFTRLSFNAAALIHVGDEGQLRINGGRGIQSPSLIAFGYRLPLSGFPAPYPVLISGDPAIKPVPVWSAEVGYHQTIAQRLAVDATLFYTRTDDTIASPGSSPVLAVRLAPTPVLLARFANVGDYETYGVELGANGSVAAHLTWRANYTLTETDQDVPVAGDEVSYPVSPAATTARHKANLVLDYDQGRWFGSVVARYTSATRQFAYTAASMLTLVDVDDALALDAKVGFRLRPAVRLTLAGENLTGSDGAAGSPIPADTRVRVGVSFAL